MSEKLNNAQLVDAKAVTLYGASYSVYVRIVRLALAEKGVLYKLVPVDIFAAAGPSAEYLQRQPFGRIPALEHGDFSLYEAGAISRYVDEAFPGPPLQPSTPQLRARVNQVISILDSYAYPSMVWDIFVERVKKPRDGLTTDEKKISSALPRAAVCLAALADIMGSWPFLAGTEISLADLHATPMFALFTQTPESQQLLQPYQTLREWWGKMTCRPSFTATGIS